MEESWSEKCTAICWMNTAKRQRSSSGSKGKPLGLANRMRRPSPTLRDPFDALRPADRKKFGVALKKHVTPALESLKRFSNSIFLGTYPEWPGHAELSLFTHQIEIFRLISNRRTSASPMEVIRDMDHRWPGIHIARTLDRAVLSLESTWGARCSQKPMPKQSSVDAIESKVNCTRSCTNSEQQSQQT